MKTANELQVISAGISLYILAVGFSVMGFLLFQNGFYGRAATVNSSDCGFYLACSIASFGIGLAFFIAALIYRRFYARNRRAGERKQGKSVSPAQVERIERSSRFKLAI